MKDREVGDEEFRKAVRGRSPEVMLPILKVPRRLFKGDGQALMLLPGYEPRSKKNEAWQDMMRQVLIGAAGCAIVTDQTRLANQQQLEIVHDMLSNELRTTLPLIVVSKTENIANQPDRLDELRKTAVSIFGRDEQTPQVICSGVGNGEYVARWLPQLQAALGELSVGGGATRQMQLKQLETLLNCDLQRALYRISRQADVYALAESGDEGAKGVLKRVLENFDHACAQLKKKHRKEVESMLSEQLKAAKKSLQERLAKDHEGLWNKITHGFESVSEEQGRLEGNVSGAWQANGAITPQYVEALGKLTWKSTAPSLPMQTSAPTLQQLGYVDVNGKSVAASEASPVLIRPDVQNNLAALFGSPDTNAPALRSNPEFERTIKLIPTMALEYVRLAGAMPELLAVYAEELQGLPKMDLLKSMQTVQSQFDQFKDTSVTLLKSLALMLAVDVAADAELDTVPKLLSMLGLGSIGSGATAGGSATVGGDAATVSAASTVAAAVAGVVAVGYLAHAALQEVRRHDGQVSVLAHGMLLNICDHHLVHFDEHFDDLMDRVRSRLEESLRRRYGLDMRFMKQDRLAKALADTEKLKDGLCEILASSGQVLF
jgi:hypothetical protein